MHVRLCLRGGGSGWYQPERALSVAGTCRDHNSVVRIASFLPAYPGASW